MYADHFRQILLFGRWGDRPLMTKYISVLYCIVLALFLAGDKSCVHVFVDIVQLGSGRSLLVRATWDYLNLDKTDRNVYPVAQRLSELCTICNILKSCASTIRSVQPINRVL